jgi:hypothetical protein
MRYCRIVFAFVLLVLAAACGSGSNDGSASSSILIDTPTAADSYTLSARETSLSISGSVSESPLGQITQTACNCVGFQCFFDPQCVTVSSPRVAVTVTNQTTGESFPGIISFNSQAPSETSYRWTATVSLVVGENRITATADDGQGIHGNDVVIIANP